MQTIFRYPGGKSSRPIREWILSHRPAGAKAYREAFVGGGGVFFAAEGFRSYWLNDLHPGLVAVYKALRDRPETFIHQCRAVTPARPGEPLTDHGPNGGKRLNRRLKAEFDRLLADDGADAAYRFYFLNRTSYGGVTYGMKRTRFTYPEGWNITAGDALELAAAKLAGVRITRGDFAAVLRTPGKGVWIYADPPYVIDAMRRRASSLYRHSFTLEDHRRFAEAVKRCPHKIAVSYGDDGEGFIRSLYPPSQGFHVAEASWSYGPTGSRELRGPGRELLILNYPPPAGALKWEAKAVNLPRGRLTSRERFTRQAAADAPKRAAVLALLNDPEQAGRSVAWLARTAGVSWFYVHKLLGESGIDREKVKGSNGKTYPARIDAA